MNGGLATHLSLETDIPTAEEALVLARRWGGTRVQLRLSGPVEITEDGGFWAAQYPVQPALVPGAHVSFCYAYNQNRLIETFRPPSKHWQDMSAAVFDTIWVVRCRGHFLDWRRVYKL